MSSANTITHERQGGVPGGATDHAHRRHLAERYLRHGRAETYAEFVSRGADDVATAVESAVRPCSCAAP